MMDEGRFPLSLQTVLPEDFGINPGFRTLLETLREQGFWGVELNVGDIGGLTVETVRRFLSGFGLELSMLATGVMAKRRGLSLSHPDEEVRRRSVALCKETIEWVEGTQAGVILGFLKGGPAEDVVDARRRFSQSLAEIIPRAEIRSVAVLVEATNRYESSVANTLEAAAGFLEGYGEDSAQILPDTFHMNIEEADAFGALRAHWGRVRSIHLSDNNRLFPGFGALDFGKYIAFLKAEGYNGRLAIEGNIRADIAADIKASMRLLAPLLNG